MSRRLRAAGRRLVACACLGAALGALASTADAATAYAPPAGWPDLGAMALAPADVGGASVGQQGYVKPRGDLAEYDRVFRGLSGKVGGKKLIALEDDVLLARSEGDAEDHITALTLGVAASAGEIAKSFAKGTHLKVLYTRVSRPRSLGTGDRSVGTTIRIGTKVGEIRFVFAAVRVGQIDNLFFFAGYPRVQVGVPDAQRLARITVAHTRAALVPSTTAAPTVTGTAQAGQTLTATPGTWLSFPNAYTYQWQHCDTSGANCTPIPGATSATYTAATTDAGATLLVTVTAQNAYGTGTANSTPTPVVAPAPGTTTTATTTTTPTTTTTG